jgi:hypothetical protein
VGQRPDRTACHTAVRKPFSERSTCLCRFFASGSELGIAIVPSYPRVENMAFAGGLRSPAGNANRRVDSVRYNGTRAESSRCNCDLDGGIHPHRGSVLLRGRLYKRGARRCERDRYILQSVPKQRRRADRSHADPWLGRPTHGQRPANDERSVTCASHRTPPAARVATLPELRTTKTGRIAGRKRSCACVTRCGVCCLR